MTQGTGMDAAAREHIRRYYDGTLRPDEMVAAMSQEAGWFPSRVVQRGATVSPLPDAGRGLPPLEIRDHDRTFDLYDYLSVNRVAGLMVLQDGAVIEESYSLGIGPQTQWKSCSLAKSVTATLYGIALREGAIENLDDPVTRYVPLGGLYAGVSVRQLLRMATGVRWNEDYTDPASDRRLLMDTQMNWEPGGIVRHMESLPAETPPGGSWKYNTGDSYLAGLVLEHATGTTLADYLSTKVWSKIGMEADASWWCESPGGMGIAGSGLHATLRDYARFGQFVLDQGRTGSQDLLPEGWRDEAGAPYRIGETLIPYGYMWWIPVLNDPALKGTFQAEGIYGQFIHINPRKRLVVVVLSARSKPGYRRRLEINDDAFFVALANSL